MIKKAGFMALGMFLACIGFPGSGFSETADSGFYAGPLSVTAETVVEVKTKKIVLAKPARQAPGKTREAGFENTDEETAINKD